MKLCAACKVASFFTSSVMYAMRVYKFPFPNRKQLCMHATRLVVYKINFIFQKRLFLSCNLVCIQATLTKNWERRIKTAQSKSVRVIFFFFKNGLFFSLTFLVFAVHLQVLWHEWENIADWMCLYSVFYMITPPQRLLLLIIITRERWLNTKRQKKSHVSVFSSLSFSWHDIHTYS